jgi:putative acetyltransferase
MNFSTRRPTPAEGDLLFDIWWRSVRATHTFLSRNELRALAPAVRNLKLETLDTWVLCEGAGPVGFIVMSGAHVEALFLAPERIRRGGGSLLIRLARSLRGPLSVDVNEQNVQALKFYLACGFSIVRRSQTDHDGRPFPLLHLAEPGRDAS